jgi:hypothetical protein
MFRSSWRKNLVRQSVLFNAVVVFLLVFIGSNPAFAQSPVGPSAADGAPVVRFILFWMESCGHCHEIIDNVLPSNQEEYGSQLEIALVELKTLDEVNLLYKVAEAYQIPKSEVKVPILLIGSTPLLGAQQIKDELPRLIETSLSAGGVDYPDLDDLKDVLPIVSGEEEACRIEEPCQDTIEAESSNKTKDVVPQTMSRSGQEAEASPSSTQGLLNGTEAAAAFAAGGLLALVGFALLWSKKIRRP